mgnify:CR=1 FL=1
MGSIFVQVYVYMRIMCAYACGYSTCVQVIVYVSRLCVHVHVCIYGLTYEGPYIKCVDMTGLTNVYGQ